MTGGVSDALSEPLYLRPEDGALDSDPLRLVTSAKRFSLERLALLLDGLPFEAEFPPESPWEGVVRHRPPLDLPPLGSTDDAALGEEFAAAVSRCLGDAESAVVLLSGGMDSWAVFAHAWRQTRREGRRLSAVVWNLRDQFGKATASLVHRQLRAVDISCDLHVLPAEWHALPEPRWSPLGPRHDYYTRLHQATVDHAADIGASVLLSGQGGDEVLGAWNHLSASLARGRRWRDLRSYLTSFGQADSLVEVAGEAAAIAARRLPPHLSFQLYVATALRDVVNSGRPSVLTDRYRKSVQGWTEGWLADRFESFREAGGDWTTASLRDSIFPWAYDAHPLGAPIRQRSPFVDERFVRYAFGLPPATRFRAEGPYPYQWYKALHLRLLPAALRPMLPGYKQSYSDAFRRYVLDVLPERPPLIEELGLIRPMDRLDLERVHPRLPIVVRNVERWVAGALEAGAEPVSAP
ncbi:asparagine synthase-related protein [Nonomuraea sp. NPDC050394]|uniref:asparagine synthase-related protein n=1 Tax=Nonomuraea sp. NPDC050394 TaxID=3364363 RepID=UPI0037B99D31